MEELAEAVDKWLYCHWDSHKHDVQFGNEAELDKHLYSHYTTFDDRLVPKVENDPRTVECHWDACHETFNVDKIMDHFYSSHQVESLHPHVGSCEHEVHPCPPPHDLENQNEPYVKVNQIDTPPNEIIDHNSLPQLPKLESENCSHKCLWDDGSGLCGLVFPSSSELNSHIVHNHTGVAPHICQWEDCTRQKTPFQQRQKLVRHLQTHAKNLDYNCQACNKTFSGPTKLKEHLAAHEDSKPFECTLCHKRFKARNSYNIHLRTHTGAKPLVCPHPGCGKRFAESSNLAKHRKTHMAPQFTCDHCGRKFTRKDHLNRHCKSVHYKEISESEKSSSATPSEGPAVKNERDLQSHPTQQQQLLSTSSY